MNFTRRTALKAGLAVMAGGLAMPVHRANRFRRHARPHAEAGLRRHGCPSGLWRMQEGSPKTSLKKTDGAIAVDVFGVGQLGSQVNMLTGLQTGIVDLCAHTSGFVQTLYPKFMVVDLPFLFSDVEKAQKMLDGPVGAQAAGRTSQQGRVWPVVRVVGLACG